MVALSPLLIILGMVEFSNQMDNSVSSQALSDQARVEALQILQYADGFGIPVANEYTDVMLREFAQLAKIKGKLVAIHAAESDTDEIFSKRTFGKSEVERIFDCFNPDFLVHVANPGKEDLRIIKGRNTPIVCCPRSNAILGNGIPPLVELLESNIVIALGTDNVMINSPNLFREMDYTFNVILGTRRDPKIITPRDVLKMATINGAEALKMGNIIGSLDVGKKTDILVFHTRQNLAGSKDIIASIVHRVGPEDIQAVIVDGKIVHGVLGYYKS